MINNLFYKDSINLPTITNVFIKIIIKTSNSKK